MADREEWRSNVRQMVGCLVMLSLPLAVLIVNWLMPAAFWHFLVAVFLGHVIWTLVSVTEVPEVRIRGEVRFDLNYILSVLVRNEGSMAVFLKEVRIVWREGGTVHYHRLIPLPNSKADEPLGSGDEVPYYLAPDLTSDYVPEGLKTVVAGMRDDQKEKQRKKVQAQKLVESIGRSAKDVWVSIYSPAQELFRIDGTKILPVVVEIAKEFGTSLPIQLNKK
jgi:hypothetical protein